MGIIIYGSKHDFLMIALMDAILTTEWQIILGEKRKTKEEIQKVSTCPKNGKNK